VTLYRITPPNVTGIKNKDTGDAHGDISFWLSKKNLTAQCARDPTGFGCFLDGGNIYGRFEVEISTQFGPYFECNPINVGRKRFKPDWIDTQEFLCGQGCLFPTPEGCMSFDGPVKKHNGTSLSGGVSCWCDGTGRHNKTVGREAEPFGRTYYVGPRWWPPQCSLEYFSKNGTSCVSGVPYRKVEGWSFESTAAKACDACSQDASCEGWATDDNHTAMLFRGPVNATSAPGCIGGSKYHSRWHGGWGNAGDVGGSWYSTPVTAECAPGASLGTNGCSWRVLSVKYRNATCIDKRVDSAVEKQGSACFSTCPQPLNETADCYLQCYRNTLLGDAGYNITKMSNNMIVTPWETGFNKPENGGCPTVMPEPCKGPQCGDTPLVAGVAGHMVYI